MKKTGRLQYRNKTLRLRADLLRRLEKRAASQEVSVNELIYRILDANVPAHNPVEAMIDIAEQADRQRGGPAPAVRQFTKEEIHEHDE
ncbi:MAG: hypothetical protein ACJ78Z_01580 [Myxococcales bacterium]